MDLKTLDDRREVGCAVGPKPRTKSCAICRERSEIADLYWVRDQQICKTCGQAQIDNWNQKVKEG